MEILRCEDLVKTYGNKENEVRALRGVNLTVKKGELAAIVGASGSGKSTLLHLIGCVDKPTSGKLYVEGVDVTGYNAEKSAVFRRRKVGFIYQFYNLIPTLSVEQNILLPMKLDRKKPDKDYFTEIIDVLGMKDKLKALPSELSGGQQQRTAIARALLYKPAMILADEPTGNLDRRNSREIIDLLKISGKKLNQTILLITHDENIALEFERIITIEDGNIVSDKKTVM